MEALRAHAIHHRRGFTLDAMLRRHDGEMRWMRLSTMPIVAEGKVVRLCGTKQDVTIEYDGPGWKEFLNAPLSRGPAGSISARMTEPERAPDARRRRSDPTRRPITTAPCPIPGRGCAIPAIPMSRTRTSSPISKAENRYFEAHMARAQAAGRRAVRGNEGADQGGGQVRSAEGRRLSLLVELREGRAISPPLAPAGRRAATMARPTNSSSTSRRWPRARIISASARSPFPMTTACLLRHRRQWLGALHGRASRTSPPANC